MIFVGVLFLLQLILFVNGHQDFRENAISDVLTFERNRERFTRSGETAFIDCNSYTQNSSLLINSEVKTEIECHCQHEDKNTVIAWFNGTCELLVNSTTIQTKGQNVILTAHEDDAHFTFYCVAVSCIELINIHTTSLQPTTEGMTTGIRGFIIFLIVSIIVLSVLFLTKKFKSRIYLTCRDSCGSNTDDDGKEFDAYVSIGKGDSDLRFVERNITDILEKKLGYKLFVDDGNILPQLDYSKEVENKMCKSRRLIIVFTAAYMTNEWCMYCLAEGLRKLLELNMPMLFIINDVSIQREMSSFNSLIAHIPIIFMPLVQTEKEFQRNLRHLRIFLPPKHKRAPTNKGMRSPMLSDAESVDQQSIHLGSNYGGTETKYSFGKPPNSQQHDDDISMTEMDDNINEMEFDDDNGTDPNAITVHQYQPRKDFYSITLTGDA